MFFFFQMSPVSYQPSFLLNCLWTSQIQLHYHYKDLFLDLGCQFLMIFTVTEVFVNKVLTASFFQSGKTITHLILVVSAKSMFIFPTCEIFSFLVLVKSPAPMIITSVKSSVIRQKGEFQNRCFKETKHIKFSGKRTFLTPWYTHVRVRIRG